jgi:membrane-associated phospholipid phosphatase
MRRLNPLEGLTIIFIGIILMVIILFYPRFPNGWALFTLFIPLFMLAFALSKLRVRWKEKKAVRFICNFSPIFFVITLYEGLADLIPFLRTRVDELLIKIDFALFGVHPTIWLERYSSIWLTDLLSLAYASYYFLPVILITTLYFRGKKEEFAVTIFTLLLGYYISFLGYMAMPAIGPRFTLISLQKTPIKGGVITEFIIHILNLLERTKHDCFPSGHTQIVLISVWFAYQYRRFLYWIFLPIIIALIFSTIYLRYHYVIDIVAGVAFAGITVVVGPALWKWWVRGRSDKSCRSCIVSPPKPLSPSA